jgi:hypothetical protein
MAKKKSASAPTPSTATATTSKKTTSAKSASNGDATTAPSVLGAEQIGLTAGAVWLYLSDKGETSLATLKKEVSASADLVLAAIGWLAREEKLEFTVSGKTVKVALK